MGPAGGNKKENHSSDLGYCGRFSTRFRRKSTTSSTCKDPDLLLWPFLFSESVKICSWGSQRSQPDRIQEIQRRNRPELLFSSVFDSWRSVWRKHTVFPLKVKICEKWKSELIYSNLRLLYFSRYLWELHPKMYNLPLLLFSYNGFHLSI